MEICRNYYLGKKSANIPQVQNEMISGNSSGRYLPDSLKYKDSTELQDHFFSNPNRSNFNLSWSGVPYSTDTQIELLCLKTWTLASLVAVKHLKLYTTLTHLSIYICQLSFKPILQYATYHLKNWSNKIGRTICQNWQISKYVQAQCHIQHWDPIITYHCLHNLKV